MAPEYNDNIFKDDIEYRLATDQEKNKIFANLEDAQRGFKSKKQKKLISSLVDEGAQTTDKLAKFFSSQSALKTAISNVNDRKLKKENAIIVGVRHFDIYVPVNDSTHEE